MNKVKATIEFNEQELWDLKCALKRDLDDSKEWAEKQEDKHRVFKMNAQRKVKLFLKIAPLVESYQSVQATLDNYPLDEFKTIR